MTSVLGLPTSDARDVLAPRALDPAVMDEAEAWVDAQLRVVAQRPSTSARPAVVDAVERPAIAPTGGRLGAGLRRAVPTLLLLGLLNLAVVLDGLLVARVYAVAALLVLPGAVVAATVRTRPAEGAVRLTLAAAGSAVSLMVVALACDGLLPLAGVGEPLARLPMLIAIDIAVVLALAVAARRRDPIACLLGDRAPTGREIAIGAALAALPALGAGGAQAVDRGYGPVPAVIAMVVCGVVLVGLVVGARRLPDWSVRAGLYAVALTLVYSFSFAGDRLYGWDVQQELQAFATTMRSNAWHPIVDQDPYRAMLSITALPAVLARVSGMSGESLFRGAYPMLFASFPVMVYTVAARRLSRTAAVAAAGFVVVQLAFAQQLPAIARQEIALVLFGVLVAIAFDDRLGLGYRRGVVLVAGASLAFTHYSTAYVTALVLLGASLLGSIVRPRGGSHRRRVLGLPIVLAVLGFTMLWNFGITRSSDNVLRFTEQVAERGPEFLPSGEGRSLVDRWVVGNAPQRISGEEYARRIALIYDTSAPWLDRYPDEVVDAHPVVEASSPQLTGLLPELRGVQATALVVASQGVLALTGVGVLYVGWRRRRDPTSGRELALVGVTMLGFVAAMRVSGVAAEAYNQERAQIHAAVVLSVGFAALLSRLLARWRRTTLVGTAAALVVVFLATSGLGAMLSGGAPPANLADRGDARDRFAVTDPEVAAVRWLADHRAPDSLVYTDRYGKLRVWAAAVPIDGAALQAVLVPATLDRNGYVLATESNVVGGIARGAIGADFAAYAFPRAFLDEQKAAIYSTDSTVVYR